MRLEEEVSAIVERRQDYRGVLILRPEFVQLTDDIPSALLLGQLVYWTDRSTCPGGWVYKTCKEWCEELHLGRRALERARAHLSELGFIETCLKRARGCATTHYRVRSGVLVAALRSLSDGSDAAAIDTSMSESADAGERSEPDTLHESVTSACADRAEGVGRKVQSGLYESANPITDITPETTAEKTSETTSETSAEYSQRDEEGEGEETSSESAACDVAPTEQEKRLYDIFAAVHGMDGERNYAQFRAALRQFPSLDYEWFFKCYAEVWRGHETDSPWLALRRGLIRAASAQRPTRDSVRRAREKSGNSRRGSSGRDRHYGPTRAASRCHTMVGTR